MKVQHNFNSAPEDVRGNLFRQIGMGYFKLGTLYEMTISYKGETYYYSTIELQRNINCMDHLAEKKEFLKFICAEYGIDEKAYYDFVYEMSNRDFRNLLEKYQKYLIKKGKNIPQVLIKRYFSREEEWQKYREKYDDSIFINYEEQSKKNNMIEESENGSGLFAFTPENSLWEKTESSSVGNAFMILKPLDDDDYSYYKMQGMVSGSRFGVIASGLTKDGAINFLEVIKSEF